MRFNGDPLTRSRLIALLGGLYGSVAKAEKRVIEFEKAIAHTNRDLAPIETIFLLTAASTSYISSSIVREVIRNNGDYTLLVPDSVRVEN